MNLSGICGKYLACWRETARMLKHPVVLLPFILLAVCKLGVLLILRYYMHAPLSWFMIDIVRMIGGEASMHYPAHLIMLPYLYELASLPIIVFGFALFGWAVFMMADHYDGAILSTRYYMSRIIWNMPAFLFIGILFAAFGISVPFVSAMWAQKIVSPGWRTLFERVSWITGFCARAALVYALLFVRMYRDDLVRALRESAGFAVRRMLLTIMILLTVSAVHAPLNYLTGHALAVARAFEPERIVYVLELGIVIEILTGVFLFASTTFLVVGGKRQPGRTP